MIAKAKQNRHRHGLTIIPLMASLTILSIFLGIMARQQVAAQKQWRQAMRTAQARQIAESEKSKIRLARRLGQMPATSQRLIGAGQWPGLQESVEIRLSGDAKKPGRIKLSVKIPAEAASAYALIEWSEP
jgi:type II secretory pathway pseudopilin PulG